MVDVRRLPRESNSCAFRWWERGDLLISIQRAREPALAKKIRQDVERRYGAEYGIFLDKLSSIRTGS